MKIVKHYKQQVRSRLNPREIEIVIFRLEPKDDTPATGDKISIKGKRRTIAHASLDKADGAALQNTYLILELE